MPKVSLDPLERKRWQLMGYITQEMKKKKVSQRQMSDALRIDQSTFSRKLVKGDFKYIELIVIFKVLETDGERQQWLMTI